jgi:cyclopropane-fatty-acyl-phospholipid synthase
LQEQRQASQSDGGGVQGNGGVEAVSARAYEPQAPPYDPVCSPPHSLEKRLVERLLEVAQCWDVGVRLWDGTVVSAPGATPKFCIHVFRRRTMYLILGNPLLEFGDAYARGEIGVEGDLVALLESIYRGIANPDFGKSWRVRMTHWFNRRRKNSLKRSQDNVWRHYDIGDDFYELWLDREMVYTCAYFANPEATLEEAQTAKLDHVCRKLRLRPGDRVTEAGCGWGSLALHMAKKYGARVRAFNISKAQLEYARRRARVEGLDSQVEFIDDDYRNITGECDAFVSVGMLEHVGRENYEALGRVIDRCLSPNGRGLLHSIGQNTPAEVNPWIRKRIFPGAYPPTLREALSVLEPFGFSILDVENLRLHYAQTLRHWLSRYEASVDQVAAMFDEKFVRTWRLYLSGSIAGFKVGALQLFQIVFARPDLNDLPWTRAHLYETAAP